MKARHRDTDRETEGLWFGRVLSSGQRTMQGWHRLCPVPEGIECHMVPLMSRASLEGDVGHKACVHVLFLSAFVHVLVRSSVCMTIRTRHT